MQRVVKRWPGWVLLVLVVVGALAVGASRADGPGTPAERAQAHRAAHRLPGVRRRERVRVAEHGIGEHPQRDPLLVDAGGLSDDEIVGVIESRFGGQVLLVPQCVGLRRPGVGAAGGRPGVRGRRARRDVPALASRRHRRTGDPTDEDRALVAAALAVGEPRTT